MFLPAGLLDVVIAAVVLIPLRILVPLVLLSMSIACVDDGNDDTNDADGSREDDDDDDDVGGVAAPAAAVVDNGVIFLFF